MSFATSIADDLDIVDGLESVSVRNTAGNPVATGDAKRSVRRMREDAEATDGLHVRDLVVFSFKRASVTSWGGIQPGFRIVDAEARSYIVTDVSEAAVGGIVRAETVELTFLLPQSVMIQSRSGAQDAAGAAVMQWSDQGAVQGRLSPLSAEIDLSGMSRSMRPVYRLYLEPGALTEYMASLETLRFVVTENGAAAPSGAYRLVSLDGLSRLGQLPRLLVESADTGKTLQ